MKKSAVRDAILLQLRAELATQANAAVMAREEAISEESRAENKWDTHSQEAAYLAEGQAKLAAEIGSSVEIYTTLALPDFAPGDSIAVGCLVEVESEKGNVTTYFIGPRAGGLELDVAGKKILVLTLQSPLGRQLLGRRQNDVVETPGRNGRAVRQRITSVA